MFEVWQIIFVESGSVWLYVWYCCVLKHYFIRKERFWWWKPNLQNVLLLFPYLSSLFFPSPSFAWELLPQTWSDLDNTMNTKIFSFVCKENVFSHYFYYFPAHLILINQFLKHISKIVFHIYYLLFCIKDVGS